MILKSNMTKVWTISLLAVVVLIAGCTQTPQPTTGQTSLPVSSPASKSIDCGSDMSCFRAALNECRPAKWSDPGTGRPLEIQGGTASSCNFYITANKETSGGTLYGEATCTGPASEFGRPDFLCKYCSGSAVDSARKVGYC